MMYRGSILLTLLSVAGASLALEPPPITETQAGNQQVFRGVGEHGEVSFSDTATTNAEPLIFEVHRPTARQARSTSQQALKQALIASELAQARAQRSSKVLQREREATAAENERLRLQNQRLLDERAYARRGYVGNDRFGSYYHNARLDPPHNRKSPGRRHDRPTRGGPPPLFATDDEPLFQRTSPRTQHRQRQTSSSTVN